MVSVCYVTPNKSDGSCQWSPPTLAVLFTCISPTPIATQLTQATRNNCIFVPTRLRPQQNSVPNGHHASTAPPALQQSKPLLVARRLTFLTHRPNRPRSEQPLLRPLPTPTHKYWRRARKSTLFRNLHSKPHPLANAPITPRTPLSNPPPPPPFLQPLNHPHQLPTRAPPRGAGLPAVRAVPKPFPAVDGVRAAGAANVDHGAGGGGGLSGVDGLAACGVWC
jgi:hypothetical protein